MIRYPVPPVAPALRLKHLLDRPLRWAPGQAIVYRELWQGTFAGLRERLGRLGRVLADLGVRSGEAVGVLDWDSHRYLELFLGVPMTGAVLHTVNTRLSPAQILYTINHAEDAVLFVHPDFLPLVEQLRPQFSTVRAIVPLADPGAATGGDDYESRLAAATPVAEFPDLPEDMVATTFYTTGTTGEPKGVCFTHRQLVLHTLGAGLGLAAFGDPFSFRQDDVYLPLTPMFHVHAWGLPFLATLLGVKQVYPGRFDPDRAVRLLREHRVTVSHGVPTILQRLLDRAQAAGVRFEGLKMLIGGSALTPGLCRRAREFGIEVTTGYGMSETSPILTVALAKPGASAGDPDAAVALRTTTGFPLPLVQARVVDEEGREQPAGREHPGELVVRAPWLTAGYVKQPERSRDLWRGGWLHTGDVAYADGEGYLHLTDRLKDVIKTGGEWVSSVELEALLSQHPAVAEVAVVGRPDERWGERPVAFVVPRSAEHGPTASDLRDFLGGFVSRGALSKWAVPDDFRIVATLPKTSVGKLNKRVLRDQAQP